MHPGPRVAKALNCEAASPPCGSCRRCRLIERGLHPGSRGHLGAAAHRVLRVEDVEAIQAEAALLPTDTERKGVRDREAELLTQPPLGCSRPWKSAAEAVQVLTTSDPEACCRRWCLAWQVRLRPLGRERLADYLMSERGVASEHAARREPRRRVCRPRTRAGARRRPGRTAAAAGRSLGSFDGRAGRAPTQSTNVGRARERRTKSAFLCGSGSAGGGTCCSSNEDWRDV